MYKTKNSKSLLKPITAIDNAQTPSIFYTSTNTDIKHFFALSLNKQNPIMHTVLPSFSWLISDNHWPDHDYCIHSLSRVYRPTAGERLAELTFRPCACLSAGLALDTLIVSFWSRLLKLLFLVFVK